MRMNQAKTEIGSPMGSDLCPIHKKPLDIVCIDCKERICSACALFGAHKGHNVKEETAVLEEINIRSEALGELFSIVNKC